MKRNTTLLLALLLLAIAALAVAGDKRRHGPDRAPPDGGACTCDQEAVG